ncbi:MAG: peptide deformylase [Rhizobiaceae bacterium]|nr:peptide deformylase [Rhizobiaceae bacterium]
MSIKQIINIPDPILRQVSRSVARFDDELQTLLDDMLETMYDAPGIGLAAIQVGIPLRVITLDVSPRKNSDEDGHEDDEEEAPEPDPIFLINPEILNRSDERSIYEEGCLSIPDYYADVERPSFCKVKYLDRKGKEQIMDADKILATCIQHEIDHLDGVLFIDHISKLKRNMVVKKFTKIAKQSGSGSGKRMVG